MNRRLALSGKLASGKTPITEYLMEHHRFTEAAFADRLKELAAELFNMKAREKDRHLLQQIGDTFRRIDTQVWVRYLLERLPPDDVDVVVSDVRYPNEFESLLERGFRMVRIDVDSGIQKLRVRALHPNTPPALLSHVSETALDDETRWHYRIKIEGQHIQAINRHVDLMLESVFGWDDA